MSQPARSPFTVGLVCSLGVGAARGGRACNEDNYLVCRDGEIRYREGVREEIQKGAGEGVLLAVADGMGGHAEGEMASAAAVQALSRLYLHGRPAAPELALHRFVVESHRQIRQALAPRGRIRIGTTLTALWILDGWMHWVHVGDSRLYVFRRGVLTRLTRDQTRGEFAERDRLPPPPSADLLAQNFIYGSRGLGHDETLRLDPGLDASTIRVLPGDRLLLCTDGLSAWVDESRLRDALREVASDAACAEVLLERAIALGSTDNVTAVVASHEPAHETPDGRLPPVQDEPIIPD